MSLHDYPDLRLETGCTEASGPVWAITLQTDINMDKGQYVRYAWNTQGSSN